MIPIFFTACLIIISMFFSYAIGYGLSKLIDKQLDLEFEEKHHEFIGYLISGIVGVSMTLSVL